MRKLMLAAGVAALAITTPLAAQSQGRGKDKDHGNKPSQSMKDDRGGKPDKGHGNQRAQNGGGDDHGRGKPQKTQQASQGQDRQGYDDRGKDRDKDVRKGRDHDDVRVVVDRRGDRDRDRRDWRRDDDDWDPYFFRYGDARGKGLVNGCPPGLAKKHNGCLPPGQAKKLWGTRAQPSLLERVLRGPYSTWYGDRDGYRYRMGDDYIYRIGRNGLIDGLIPLYDRPGYYYPIGSTYPAAYDFYNLPYQYRGYYNDPYYRYGDGAIYRVDPKTQLIRSVAALLTGDMMVGQPMPSRYSVYNVPYGYRQSYYDSPSGYYRYSDGYIYRVDPKTMLVAEAIKAII